MTNIITLIVLVSSVGIVLVYGECLTNDATIESCCCLGYNNTYFNAKSSGVYTIANFYGVKCSNTRAFCDTSSGRGGWLVVQRRKDGSVDFNRSWVDYEDGFGSLTGEFWYGLRPLHCLTNQGQWEMCIDFTLTDGTNSYLSYSSFKIGPASSNYKLSISGYNGIASSDPFSSHPLNGMPFTTKDRDNDNWNDNFNCALDNVGNAGGWWYNVCSHTFLNHQYKNTYGIRISGSWKSLSFTEMKIRPLDCKTQDH